MNRYNKTLDEKFREWRRGFPALPNRDVEELRRKAAANAALSKARLEGKSNLQELIEKEDPADART